MFSANVKHIVNVCTQGRVAPFARVIGYKDAAVHHWISGDVQPSLMSVLAFAYACQVDATTLLRESISERILSKEFNQVRNTWSKVGPFPPKGKILEKITPALKELKNKNISMNKLCKTIGVPRSTFEKHFPDLKKEMTARFLTHRETQKKSRLDKIISAMKQATLALIDNGIEPTLSRVSNQIQCRFWMRLPDVIEEYNKFLIDYSQKKTKCIALGPKLAAYEGKKEEGKPTSVSTRRY